MTGYGAAEKEGFKVEVRSLNHKYIDISVRVPSALAEHEIPIRNLVKEKFGRGKFDITISFTDKRHMKVSINTELAREIYEAFLDVQNELSIPGRLSIDFFSGYRELLLAEEPEYDTGALYEAFHAAVLRVMEMRNKEGEALKADLAMRLGKVESMHREVEKLSKGMAYNYREVLLKRIAEITQGMTVDETRLAQEIALIAQRSDISEETARLKSHIQQFSSLLNEGGTVGRRLDFILQEMNREVNTIASKADDVRIINCTIEAKSEMEKLREQVQNIQ